MDCFLTWSGASFSAVTPVTHPPSLFSRATPGPAISPTTTECPVPGALCVHSALKLEWEDALPPPVSRLALRGGLHVGGQGEEKND